MVDVDDVEEGYTIVVEPMSGRVRLLPKVIDQHDAFADVPNEGPTIP